MVCDEAESIGNGLLLRFVRVSKFCFFYNLFIELNVSLANSSPSYFYMQPQNLDP